MGETEEGSVGVGAEEVVEGEVLVGSPLCCKSDVRLTLTTVGIFEGVIGGVGIPIIIYLAVDLNNPGFLLAIIPYIVNFAMAVQVLRCRGRSRGGGGVLLLYVMWKCVSITFSLLILVFTWIVFESVIDVEHDKGVGVQRPAVQLYDPYWYFYTHNPRENNPAADRKIIKSVRDALATVTVGRMTYMVAEIIFAFMISNAYSVISRQQARHTLTSPQQNFTDTCFIDEEEVSQEIDAMNNNNSAHEENVQSLPYIFVDVSDPNYAY